MLNTIDILSVVHYETPKILTDQYTWLFIYHTIGLIATWLVWVYSKELSRIKEKFHDNKTGETIFVFYSGILMYAIWPVFVCVCAYIFIYEMLRKITKKKLEKIRKALEEEAREKEYYNRA